MINNIEERFNEMNELINQIEFLVNYYKSNNDDFDSNRKILSQSMELSMLQRGLVPLRTEEQIKYCDYMSDLITSLVNIANYHSKTLIEEFNVNGSFILNMLLFPSFRKFTSLRKYLQSCEHTYKLEKVLTSLKKYLQA